VVGRWLAHPAASNQRVDGRLPPAHVPAHCWAQHVGLCCASNNVRSSAAERADGRAARGARVVASWRCATLIRSACTRAGTPTPRTCSRPACHFIPSRSYSGTPSSRSPGTCTATSPTRARALPSSGSQQQWAGENVRRGYTNGYTAAKRPPRISSETASDLLFPVGMTGFEPATP
jgi:hypothetical protein